MEGTNVSTAIQQLPSYLEAFLQLQPHSPVHPQRPRYTGSSKEAFTALTPPFFQDGAFVFLPRGLALQKPIYLLDLNTGRETPRIANPRNLIMAGENSQGTILEDYVSLGVGVSFTNVVTEVVAGEQAVAQPHRIRSESTETFLVPTPHLQQGSSTAVKLPSVLTGGVA